MRLLPQVLVVVTQTHRKNFLVAQLMLMRLLLIAETYNQRKIFSIISGIGGEDSRHLIVLHFQDCFEKAMTSSYALLKMIHFIHAMIL